MKPVNHSTFHKYGPPTLLLVLLLVIGFGIHEKSVATKIPPIFDSLNYYQKSKEVWEQLSHGHIKNTFNVARPVFRPPGVALVSYPFGFTKEYSGFFFRNAYIPIVIWVSALWFLSLGIVTSSGQRWLAAALIAGFASFSMFYHFTYDQEIDGPWGFSHPWGMQDCLLASLGSLTAALLMLSARKRSIGLSVAGALVGAWALLIKPTGALLMPLVFWVWMIETWIQNWPLRSTWRLDRSFRIYVVSAASITATAFSAIFLVCVRTKYLSAETRAFFSGALKVVKDSFSSPMSLSYLNRLVSPSLGWHWFIFLFVTISLLAARFVYCAVRLRLKPEDFRFPAALLGLSGGLYWWWSGEGVQVRYVFPFILVFVTGILPDLIRFASRLRFSTRVWFASLCFVPSVLVCSLVLTKEGSVPIQRAMGVSVRTGAYDEELRIANHLLSEVRMRNAPVLGYSLEADSQFGIIHGVSEIARIADPEKPYVGWHMAFDWARGFLISQTKLLSSGYILYRTPIGDVKSLLETKEIATSQTESDFFKAWFDQLGDEAGIRVVLRGGYSLLQIVDQLKFDQAFENLKDSHKWRELFTAENALTSNSAMPQKFGASKATLFRASPDQNVSALQPNADMSIASERDRIVLYLTGDDPVMQLPDLAVPPKHDVMVRICLDSPAKTSIAVRYATGAASGFGASQPLAQELFIGFNELYFLVPSEGARVRITLNPTKPTKRLSIRDIELRAVARP